MTWSGAIKKGHPGSLYSAFLYFDVSFMIWVLLGPLALFITQDLSLTPAQKGLMVAFPLLGGAILRLPAGFLTDYLGPKKTGVIGLLMTMIPLVWGWVFGGRSREQALRSPCPWPAGGIRRKLKGWRLVSRERETAERF